MHNILNEILKIQQQIIIITLFKDKAVMEKCDISPDKKCATSEDTKSADTGSADLSANNGAIAATSKKTDYEKVFNCPFISINNETNTTHRISEKERK